VLPDNQDYPNLTTPGPEETLPLGRVEDDTGSMIPSNTYNENLAIFSLRAAAIRAEDFLTVAFCDRALDGMVPREVWNAMTPDQRRESNVSQEKARRKCFRTIATRTAHALQSLDAQIPEPSLEYSADEPA
jgi:hypothetical protein